ncbi:MAG TPA: glutamine synthetase family protein [Longimicrobium sp.]|nr:glutamine synthetase family protein [Longimicrobium sp.]
MAKAGEALAGRISLDELERAIRGGEIDTVVNAVTDMQGRLMGKRITGEFFLENGRHGTHFCTYLMATDMEMATPPGYALANWESGYGDWLADPDWSTLRAIPWLEKTALVMSDAKDEATGALIPVAPRSILRRQVERAAEMGYTPKMASELEFYVLKETYEEAAEKGFQGLTPFGWYNEDYHLLQATKAEPLYRRFRNEMTAAGVPIEFSKGEAAPGQHEVNIRYGDALEGADRHALFKHGVKEMAWQSGHAVTFMAKPDHRWTGNSAHVHLSLWDGNGGRNLFHEEGAEPYGMSRAMRHFLGGMMHCARDLAFFIAPFVNSYKRYAVASWAPVNIVWGRDNRTCGFRVVGGGSALRVENRLPGGDANPYLAYAAIIGAGLYGIEHEIEPPAEFHGNAYTSTGHPKVPRALWEAAELLEESTIAREIFGDEVVQHYANAARVEQGTYDAVVTSWERERYLERG